MSAQPETSDSGGELRRVFHRPSRRYGHAILNVDEWSDFVEVDWDDGRKSTVDADDLHFFGGSS